MINDAIRKLGKGVQAVFDIARTPSRSPEELAYFGQFTDALNAGLTERGSEFVLGLTLFSLLVSIRAERAIEIGRFQGFSTLALAGALRFCDWGWDEHPSHRQRSHEIDYEVLEAPKLRK